MTIESTLNLVSYLKNIGFKYILTANLSQDRLENLFGIVRQSAGTNDHPTAAQFLVIVHWRFITLQSHLNQEIVPQKLSLL